MTLGILLALGDSFGNLAKSGQDKSFKEFYLSKFAKNFDKVYVFSYEDEKVAGLPKNVIVVPAKKGIHRYLQAFLIPFIHRKILLKCNVVKTYHLTGALVAVLVRITTFKPFVFNYAYDYFKFAILEGKFFQLGLLFVFRPISVLTSSAIFAANREVMRQLPKNKTYYLPNGVNVRFFKPQKKHNKKKPLTIMSVGRLEKQKNYENLLIALKNVNANLLIVGDGPLKAKLINQAKRLGIKLRLKKFIHNTDMPRIYNLADIFVNSSQLEGSPKALLEAMSMGLPVVATKVNGNREVIKNNENGIFCDTNPSSIGEAITKLIENAPLREYLGKNARSHILKNFNLEKNLSYESKLLTQIAKFQ